MDHLTIQELIDFIKIKWPKLSNMTNDPDTFLMSRTPIELLLLASEVANN